MTSKKICSSLGSIPNPFSNQECLFHDINEARFAIRGVLRAYFGNDSSSDEDYLFFKASRVRFEKDPIVDLELDHRRRLIIFVVNEPIGKDAEENKRQIKKQLTMEFAVLASDMRGKTAMSIYRALKPRARQVLLDIEKEREKKEA